ncbi:MAG: hypothetical protein JNK05_22615 [Myxococcales bacterium]|nr:hypothetical protein [Myxococcales bacterium]
MSHRHRFIALVLAATSAHCATTSSAGAPKGPTTVVSMQQTPTITPIAQPQPAMIAARPAPPPRPTERDILLQAEQQAPAGARRVLSTARTLIDDEVVIRGTCYTWLSAVYRQAGGRFGTVYSGDRRGRYATADQLQPGDWIHFINHSYNNVTHSAIFIAWTDRDARTALTVSYPGERREVPGRYREYELTSVYRVDRMRD